MKTFTINVFNWFSLQYLLLLPEGLNEWGYRERSEKGEILKKPTLTSTAWAREHYLGTMTAYYLQNILAKANKFMISRREHW